jgi:transposase
LKPKSHGAGIMVSDFIDENNGYLKLTNDEYQRAKQQHPNLRQQAREFLEYGKEHDGYWTSERFLSQLHVASTIAEIKYPKESGYRIYFIFDHSSCRGTFAQDALDASKMNLNPGGKQPRMQDTYWNGKLQKMVLPNGSPKGLKLVLQERGVNVRGKKLEELRRIMSMYSDFHYEKPEIYHYLQRKGHGCLFLPKFHCEINPIEKCWSQAKRYTRARTNYTIMKLRTLVPDGLDSVKVDNIVNYFRKTRHYMYGYLAGSAGGSELDELVVKYKKEYKSHRRPLEND